MTISSRFDPLSVIAAMRDSSAAFKLFISDFVIVTCCFPDLSCRHSFGRRKLSLQIRPELRRQVLYQIESQRDRPLTDSQFERVKALRIPEIREKCRPICAAHTPCRKCFRAGIGFGENRAAHGMSRSEERRVGKKGRSRWSP